MGEVAAAERAAARAGQKPPSPFLRSPSPSPSQLSEPQEKQAKESVIKQMQAFCKLSPVDRRAALNESGCSRKVISDKVTIDRPQLPKSSGPREDLRKLRPSAVCSKSISSDPRNCAVAQLWQVVVPSCMQFRKKFILMWRHTGI